MSDLPPEPQLPNEKRLWVIASVAGGLALIGGGAFFSPFPQMRL